MKRLIAALAIATTLVACDDSRVSEKIVDLDSRQWLASDALTFDFLIDDTGSRYNVYADVRNAVSYPYARLFYTYHLKDSTGVEIQNNLQSEYLFDAKTGKPFGKSGVGDLYDHRFPLLKDYRFEKAGKYEISLEQFMRVDTLKGVLAVGIRVEKVQPQ